MDSPVAVVGLENIYKPQLPSTGYWTVKQHLAWWNNLDQPASGPANTYKVWLHTNYLLETATGNAANYSLIQLG